AAGARKHTEIPRPTPSEALRMRPTRGEDPRTPRLLAVITEMLAELQRDHAREVTLDSALDRELGLDSLARVELLLRVERAFGVALPENSLNVAQTPRDLLNAVDSARAADFPARSHCAGRRAPAPSPS